MIRTTLFLPDALHQRLFVLSKRRQKSFAELSRELFRKALEYEEEAEILRPYKALDQLEVGVKASPMLPRLLMNCSRESRGLERNRKQP